MPDNDQIINNACGGMLRHWRQIRRLTQADMADLAGVEVSDIHALEHGEMALTIPMALCLSTALDINLAVMFTTIVAEYRGACMEIENMAEDDELGSQVREFFDDRRARADAGNAVEVADGRSM